MEPAIRHRWIMTALGGLAALALYGLAELIEADLIGERAALLAITFAGGFFAALLAMAGEVPWRKAVPFAALAAVLPAGLLFWASFRFDEAEDFAESVVPFFAAFAVGVLPLPFLMAAEGPGWRDYPALFRHAWGLAVRFFAACAFTAIVWAVIYLSDALLSLVGLTVIDDLIDTEPVPYVISGVAFGLSLAVMQELAEVVAPTLILRLLRLLTPVVLLVSAVFLAALPFRGLSDLFGGLSAAGVLLAMAVVAATLVSTAIDQDDPAATRSPLLVRSAQGLALLLPVLAGMAAWSVWLRVGQHGWTPERLTAAVAAVIAVGYGILYALAVLRGAGWMERIRQGNVLMALGGIVAAVLILTPVLNFERISANSQLALVPARLAANAPLDFYELSRWGKAGAAALETLEAEASGNQALQEALDAVNHAGQPREVDHAAIRADLIKILPVQPAGAVREKQELIASFNDGLVLELHDSCAKKLPGGGPGCVMVVADFWPGEPGDEIFLMARSTYDYLRNEGYVKIDGSWAYRPPALTPLMADAIGDGEAMIAALQSGPPVMTAVPLQQFTVNGTAVMLMPAN